MTRRLFLLTAFAATLLAAEDFTGKVIAIIQIRPPSERKSARLPEAADCGRP
jgi:hypothetical protein